MKAVIDIGTNSVLLLIGRRRADGSLEIVGDQARVARLGQGVARTGVLDPAAIDRTLQILADYRRQAEAAGAPIEAVATEGLRLARDREVFTTAAREVLGTPVRMISGEEEARLSYLSVARELPTSGPLRVIDIGGASTELVAGHGDTLTSVVSHKIGSVRLTEEWVTEDPVPPTTIEALKSAAAHAFAEQPLPPADRLHGLAGTVTTTAALLLGLSTYDAERVDGTEWTTAQVISLRDELAAEPLEVRARRPCLPPGRADVVVAGLSILEVALTHCGAKTLVVRDRGLRYALL